MKHFNISLEDDVIETTPDEEVVTAKEKEYILYFRLLDFKQLEEASDGFKQVQWSFYVPRTEENAGSAKIRVREHTGIDGETKYILTVKSEVKDGNIESEIPVSKKVFTQFGFIADGGMHKHRYIFPIEGSDLKWEIDVYPDGNGGYYPWGRAELEVKEELNELPTLPIQVEELITPEEASTPEGKEKVKDLHEKFFLKKNKYITKVKKDEPDNLESEGSDPDSDTAIGESSDTQEESSSVSDSASDSDTDSDSEVSDSEPSSDEVDNDEESSDETSENDDDESSTENESSSEDTEDSDTDDKD